MLASLVSQITSPVRWDLCQETLASRGVEAIIELAPGGVLTGLARRTLRGVPAVAIKGPADLDAALALLSDHQSTGESKIGRASRRESGTASEAAMYGYTKT